MSRRNPHGSRSRRSCRTGGLFRCSLGNRRPGSKTHYKVGVTTPLSGVYSFLGKASLQGMKIAKADLEKKKNVKIDCR